MHIRLAASSDLPAIAAIVEGAYAVYVGRIGRRPAPMDDVYADKVDRQEIFVADAGGVAGLIVLVVLADHVLIENVAVDPGWQGRGVGRALLDHAEAHARSRGLTELRLYTNAAMTENIALYTRLGYREVERRTDDGFARVFFTRHLT